MIFSTLPYLELVASFYATIFVGFGILWFVSPAKAISFFELPYPEAAPAKGPTKNLATEYRQTVAVMGVVYGVRDVYMGAAIYAAAACGTRSALGWIMIAAGSVAATDGAACKFIVGKGQGNHWSYAPVLIALGALMLGAFDGLPLEALWGGAASAVKEL